MSLLLKKTSRLFNIKLVFEINKIRNYLLLLLELMIDFEEFVYA